MTMQMKRAFNAKMLYPLKVYLIAEGYYNDKNLWVEGRVSVKPIYGRITVGNKFSQFDEAEAIVKEDGGTRYSNYKSLYVINKYSLPLGSKVEFKGKYFNIIQKSDELIFGFESYLLEESERWKP